MSTTLSRGAWFGVRVRFSTTTQVDFYVHQARLQPNPTPLSLWLRLDCPATPRIRCDFVRCVRCVRLVHREILDQSPNRTSPRLRD